MTKHGEGSFNAKILVDFMFFMLGAHDAAL